MLAHLLKGLRQGIDGLHVQVVGGLVQEQDVGAAERDAGEYHARLLPAAELADGLQVVVPAQPEAAQLLRASAPASAPPARHSVPRTCYAFDLVLDRCNFRADLLEVSVCTLNLLQNTTASRRVLRSTAPLHQPRLGALVHEVFHRGSNPYFSLRPDIDEQNCSARYTGLTFASASPSGKGSRSTGCSNTHLDQARLKVNQKR